jgi:glutamine---fructose-6-phosphate transaminase (isomerizing)
VSGDRVDALGDDILAGPSALADLLAAYAAPRGPLAAVADVPGRVAFVGLGSSRYAALSVAAHLRSRGLAAWAEYASTGAGTRPDTDLTLVAVSASGGTAEVVDAARRHRGRSRVLAVTNRPDSALAEVADEVLPLFAGNEASGIATRTFRATVAVLGLLAGSWLRDGPTADGLRSTVDALQASIDGRDAWLAAAADRLDGAGAIDVIGDAADAALVHQAALMLREAPRLRADAHDTADWLHTAVYLAFPGHRALLFGGSPADREVVTTIARRGGQTIVIGDAMDGAAQVIPLAARPGADRVERAVVGSVVAEVLSAELWRRTTAEVREGG